MRELVVKSYPEHDAGGFTREDGTVQFYSRVHALMGPGQQILDFGAGRGAAGQNTALPPFKRKLLDLRGEGRFVTGIDVDPAVQENPNIDRAEVIGVDDPLPFGNESFDLICSDFVFEHIDDPSRVCGELNRVLKPGGWLCARTPNRFGYVALASALTPNRLHASVLKKLQPFRESRDVFPTAYKLNTPQALLTHFPSEQFSHHVYYYEAEPTYFGSYALLWDVGMLVKKVLPDVLKNALMVFVRKKPNA